MDCKKLVTGAFRNNAMFANTVLASGAFKNYAIVLLGVPKLFVHRYPSGTL